jgi:uracil-DNA glycosylase family 4
MSLTRSQLLKEIGLGPIWLLRQGTAANQPVVATADVVAEPSATSPPPSAQVAQVTQHALARNAQSTAGAPIDEVVEAMDWEQLTNAVRDCRKCALCEGRKQAVVGVGDRDADWLFVGEGPGAEEDERGEPFVGQAGKLLDNMLAAIDLRRGENVYIANAVKCRPPNNRTPEPEETAACWPYLQRQIELIRPKLIIALGRPAAQTLLQTEVKIGAARGQLHRYRDMPLIVTYHPAYLLRNLPDKAKAWEDLCLMRATMQTKVRASSGT